jgi:hypothetical protein
MMLRRLFAGLLGCLGLALGMKPPADAAIFCWQMSGCKGSAFCNAVEEELGCIMDCTDGGTVFCHIS